jgi:sugar lactone lactonase YvrE
MKARLLSGSLPACDLGEGPHWHAAEKRLYWVDITRSAIHRFDLARGRHETCHTPSMVGFAVPETGDALVAGLEDGIYRIAFTTGKAESLVRPNYAHKDNRFNDGKCDRRGRLWAGTMNHVDHQRPSGALYRFDKRGLLEREAGMRISNGLGWSPDDRTMYYADTIGRVIWRYDYDIDTGEAANRAVFVSFPDGSRPDGLCVDAAGRVYSAQWPGWRVDIFAPDGKKENEIRLPVPQVSSCAFGGTDLKTLFVTTAAVGLTDAERREAPLSGQVFAVEMQAPGLSETPFAGGT